MSYQPNLFDRPEERKATATRDAAYRKHQAEDMVYADEDGLTPSRRAVYRVIRRNPDVTNMEIARILGWTINRVTGRTKDLRELGLVEEGRRRACQVTGNQVQAWKAVNLDPRHALNPCVRAYGYGPIGAKCKTCAHLMRKSCGKTYYKCAFRKNTNGPATDHRVGWPACAKYEEDILR